MKKSAIILLLIAAAVLFTACGLPGGYPEYEQVDADDVISYDLLRDYVTAGMYNDDPENCECFCALKIFSAEKVSDEDHYVYAWVFESVYSFKNGVLNEEGGSSYPCRLEVKKDGSTAEITAADVPGDGAAYSEDIKKLFPDYVREQIKTVQDDGTVKELQAADLEQAKAHFGAE